MILLLHDFSDFWYGWRFQLSELCKSNYVIAIDLKGFGDSDKPSSAREYKGDIVVEEIKILINALKQNGDNKVVLIGHGIGAYIGWHLVEKYPLIVEKFVSISMPHPCVWTYQKTITWRSIFKNSFLFFCRLPFLPEIDMLTNYGERIEHQRKGPEYKFCNSDKVTIYLENLVTTYLCRRPTHILFQGFLTGVDL